MTDYTPICVQVVVLPDQRGTPAVFLRRTDGKLLAKSSRRGSLAWTAQIGHALRFDDWEGRTNPRRKAKIVAGGFGFEVVT